MAITPFDYAALGLVADQLIQQFGMKASLVRNGTDYRDAWVVVADYMPREAPSQLVNPTDRMVLISAGLGGVPALPPDFQADQLVTYKQPASNPTVVDEVLPFTMPIKLYSPAGICVLYQTSVKR
jgi:hypothetical protein